MFSECTIKIHAVKINLFSKISNLSEKKQEVMVKENKVTEETHVSKIFNILVLYFLVISTSILLLLFLLFDCFLVGIN